VQESKEANISGNFETEDAEIKVVKAYLKREGLRYEKVYKYPDANAGDVMVRFPNKIYSLFEVKRESQARFNKYGEYGIDFISSLIFKKDVDKSSWKKLHWPKDFKAFLKTLDVKHKGFKWGKIAYSYSNVWLFYVQDEQTGKYTHLECYYGKKLCNKSFFKHLTEKCQFTVNIKPQTQMSSEDNFDSATFFVKPKDLEFAKVTKDNIYNHGDMGLLEMLAAC
jgi:hypothetical protein